MPGEDNNIAQPASRIPVKEPTSPSIDGDRDVISSVAKVRRKIIIAKLVKNMNVAKNLKSAKQPFKKIFACAHARFVNFPENLPP